jgi:hypothetical protein
MFLEVFVVVDWVVRSGKWYYTKLRQNNHAKILISSQYFLAIKNGVAFKKHAPSVFSREN